MGMGMVMVQLAPELMFPLALPELFQVLQSV
jgi:hypothetical protein